MNIDERIENITTGLEAMKSSLEAMKSSLDSMKERHDALTMNLELLGHEIHDLKIASQQDGENIRALARIAEIHNRRITDLEN
jgi:peptidoglycan hydrolase CwlO-like protein